MSRGAKPTKAKAKGGPPPGRRAVKKGASQRPPLDKRLAEALDQRAATSEILRVIRRSPTDVQPVFDMIAERAMRLCGALHGGVMRFDGELIHVAAHVDVSPEFAAALRRVYPIRPSRSTAGARAILTHATVHIPDVEDDPDYEFTEAARSAGFRSALAVPMLRDGQAIGAVVVFGGESTPFSERQVDLLETFADQGVIAIENVRMFKELETRNRDLVETLEQQTATSEILRVISSSPTDVQPVFDAIAAAATRLCAAENSGVFLFDGTLIHFAAHHRWTAEDLAAIHQTFPRPPGPGSVTARAILTHAVAHSADISVDPEYEVSSLVDAGFRAVLSVPMLRDGEPIGAINVTRREPIAFTDTQIALLETFARQAVIAIQNVRLFTELETRNRDLTEALEQQTATSDVLKVISRSTFDLMPVLGTLAESATRLCGAQHGHIFQFDGEVLRFAIGYGTSPDLRTYFEQHPVPLGPGSVSGRAASDRQPVHLHDVLAEPGYQFGEAARLEGWRTVLAVPMLREGALLGVIAIWKTKVEPFTEKQIALVETFADQAVIAIENVRLFKELETRNHELTETLEQQTATSEILGVISSSPTNVQPVFDTIVHSARALCGADSAAVLTYRGQMIHIESVDNAEPEQASALREAYPMRAHRGHATGRAIVTGRPVHIPDVRQDPEYTLEALRDAAGLRTVLSVPMLRDGAPIGAITLQRWGTPLPFSDQQIALLRTFADQAVIAIENVRLFQELEVRNRDLTETLGQQTATSEILRVISRSLTNIRPVLDAVTESAARLCETSDVVIFLRNGESLRLAAHHGPIPVQPTLPLVRGTSNGRSVLDGRTVHVVDMQTEADEFPEGSANARRMGHRTILCVPLMREGFAIGTILLRRTEAHLFTDRQVALLETFADQAVIAIENVRLFTELEARNHDLTETLDQQTATGEILRVISRSPTDVQPVLDTVAESAARLCESFDSAIWRWEDDRLLLVAHHGPIPVGPIGAFSLPLIRGTIAGRSMLDGRPVHVADAQAEVDEFPESSENARRMGFRTILSVPLMREGVAIGSIQIRRTEAQLFTDRQVALLQTFADQAVIAIENVRLFQELETRTRDLTQSVGELRALGEVSQAVGSTLDLETVLATIVSRAVQLSGSDQGLVYEFDEATQTFEQRATHQITPENVEALRAAPIRLGEGAMGRAGVIREPVQVADIRAEWQLVAPQVRAFLDREGVHSLLAIPLIREERLLGGLVILRTERGAFSPAVVATLQTFAAQSVLAIHNARLFREIQRQKQYSDALVETSPVAIATMDLHGTVVGWNPGAERLFGYSSAEALGRQVDDLVATPEIREEVRENLRLMHSGQRVRAITRRARKDGTLVDVEVSSMPVVVDGAEVGSIAIYHDITELLQARREAEAANEAKSAFLATMSHEIRTPMNAVIGMSGLLLNTALTDEQREYAEIVRQSGDTLLTVINDILDFSKIEAGRLDLESQPFDLRECVEGALDLVATRAAEKGLDLAYVLSDGAPAAVVGDVTRLRQVLLNLLSNAVKFTEAGEVVLSVSAHPIQGLAALHELTFSVRDTGIGIPEDRLVRLFQSFTQVDASTTRRYGGTGLGLAISQRLTELMGGRIVVTSEVGIGSDFRFTIRAVAAESPGPSRRDLSGVQPSLRGKRVLVVDDNATNRRILTLHLEAWGMLSRATGSPAEALAWIRADERFDVAILDMHMPEMDGVALAHAIRERPAGAALPLVLFTSLGRREARAEEEGFAAYLHKPIKPSQLFDALATVLADRPVHVPKPGAARTELDPDMARRHPLRILLAEDNVVNQKLAVRLLAQMGYRADLAANGLEAIDAVERQTYDVVLMDVQMPEMDGFEASREINRRWPDVPRPRLVAMTANAMEGDRELCTTAGMDDYVAKPIRVEELVAALERSRRRPDADERGAPAVAAIDRTVVERLTATMGGPFVGELIDTFAEDARELIATLRRALAENDVDAFRRAAHSLKSNGESLGATELAALARELEAMARGGSLQGAADRIEPLVAGYEAAARALGEVRRDLLS